MTVRALVISVFVVAATIGSVATAADSDGVNTNANLEKAIENYRIFLGLGIHHPQNGAVIRRLADLELIKSQRLEPGASSQGVTSTIPLSQILELYNKILLANPRGPGNDHVYYQLAKIYDLRDETESSIEWLERLMREYPGSIYADEVHFRLGEYYFANGLFPQSEREYQAVVTAGEFSAFYEKALYKYGWTLYKQGRYDDALKNFFLLLDRKLGDAKTWRVGDKPVELTRGDEELVNDIFRAVSLSASNLDGVNTLAKYFAALGSRAYQVRAYESLADHYLEQERVADATDTLHKFAQLYPGHPQAPFFQLKVMDAYREHGYKQLLLDAKIEFVKANEIGGVVWMSYGPEVQEKIRPRLMEITDELARHFHAKAQQTKNPEDYQLAVAWYQNYIRSFPGEPHTGEMNFLLADLYTEMGQLEQAAAEYEKTAYDYPSHDKSAEAGYAALYSLQQQARRAQGAEQRKLRLALVDSTIHFAERFPQDTRVPMALTKATQELFSMDEMGRSTEIAERVLKLTSPKDNPDLQRDAWTIVADAAFEEKDFVKAEASYKQLIKFIPASDPEYQKITDQLALSIYRQAEAAQTAGNIDEAISHFLRVGQAAPTSSVRVNADYDAATALLAKKDWAAAIRELEQFRQRYPDHKLQKDVTTKLAVAYMETSQTDKAAAEFNAISRQGADPELKREAAWQSAELYLKAGRSDEAVTSLKEYIDRFPTPLEPAVEARYKLATHYKDANQQSDYQYWIKEIIKADEQGGDQRTDRTRYLAASSAFVLAQSTLEPFREVKLVIPLKTSLGKKKKAMEAALSAFGEAAEYGVAEVTPAATYWIATIYEEFSQALLASERPQDLDADALEQYNVLLEEQAFPFEEKAIEIHEINAKRAASGIYNEWVRKSFAGLSKLMPVRYSKEEKGELYINAIN
jgi:tetratricopeptide (TPR) repeat protein